MSVRTKKYFGKLFFDLRSICVSLFLKNAGEHNLKSVSITNKKGITEKQRHPPLTKKLINAKKQDKKQDRRALAPITYKKFYLSQLRKKHIHLK